MKLDGQGEHPDYYKATDSIKATEVDAGLHDLRDVLTEHLWIVSASGSCGSNQYRWLKADCRPGFV
jgi:hypothetical protein